MQPTIPEGVAVVLPVVGEIVSRRLMDDQLKAWQNAVIAAIFLVLVALGCDFLAGNFTGNWQASILIIIAYCVLLMRGSLASLYQFFDLAASPLVRSQPAPVPARASALRPVAPPSRPPGDGGSTPLGG